MYRLTYFEERSTPSLHTQPFPSNLFDINMRIKYNQYSLNSAQIGKEAVEEAFALVDGIANATRVCKSRTNRD